MIQTKSADLFYEINRCANYILSGKYTDIDEFKQCNKYRGQGMLLEILFYNDGLSQKEIAKIMDIRPSSVGELVAKLDQSNDTYRKFDDHDKRVSYIFLTKTGREKARNILKAKEMFLVKLFDGLTEGDKNNLYILLKKLNFSLREKLV